MIDRFLASSPPLMRLLVLNTGLALAYYLTARLGIAMGIGPLKITAVWPPSGIALAAFMLLGSRALPGLLLGSLAAHYFDFFGPALGWGGGAVLGATAVSSGSMVQAALAAFLARQLPERVEAAPVRQTLRFAAAVAVSCLIAASVGQATLYSLGAVNASALFFGWLTWWVGDTTGMLTVAPVLLLLLHPQFFGRRVAVQAFPIICLGLGLTLFSTLSIGVMERDVYADRFRAEGTRLAMALQNHVDMAERDLEILQRAFHRIELTPAEFREIASPMLLRSPWQQDFAYLPRVEGSRRNAFEQRHEGVTLREISPRETVVLAAQREEYFPVIWTAPEAGHEALVGIDHLADPTRGPAIEKARSTGRLAASLPLHSLLQSASTDLVQVLYAPLADTALTDPNTRTASDVRGMAAATIDLGQLLRAAVAQMGIESHHLLLYDPDALGAHALEWPVGKDLVVRSRAERDQVLPRMLGGVHHEVALRVADRRWILLMQPAWAQLTPKPGWLQLVVLAAGLTFTGLLTGFMAARRRHDLLVRDQQQALEAKVAARTRDLAKSNQQLRDEVTERQHAEQQLQVFRRLAESAHQGLGISELDGTIIYLNPAMRRMAGDTDWTPAGRRKLQDYLGERRRKVFEEETLPALRETGYWEGEWHFLAREGRAERWLAQSHFVLKDDFGAPIYMASLVSDTTAQHQAEDELREAQQRAESANRAKSMFLANMSHEIRTPLNAVLGFTQILLGDKRLGDETHQRLAIILSAGNRLLGLINDVLDLAKIESGRLNLVTQPLDLHRELVEIGEMFAARVTAKGLAWSAELGALPAPSMVHGDRTKIGQVVINLLGNALKFTEAGRIRLQAWREGDAVWIEVEDTGPGMEATELERLFTPFSQGEAGRVKGGSGLGLVLSRDIARAMGGELVLDSTPGAGTRARVMLPLPEIEAAPAHAITDAPIAHLDPATPCRVLVVEDDDDSRHLLVRLLQDVGCSVREAEDGQAGLEAVQAGQAERFDIVFSDIRMPRMSGVEMIKALRASQATAQLPVVAVTASSLEHERRFYTEIGFQDFVAKPYPFRDIYQLLAKHAGVRFVEAAAASATVPAPAPAEEVLAPPDAQALQRLQQLQAAAAEGDAASVKSLLMGLGVELLGATRHRAWSEAARRYDFQSLEDAVRGFVDQLASGVNWPNHHIG